MSNRQLGALGEDYAASYLAARGHDILERNWRSKYGELDIVARESDTLVFVEVKTRTGLEFGTPAEAVTQTKQRRIRQLAMQWLAAREGRWVPIRFDVVGVIVDRDGTPTVTHVRDAF